MRQMNLMGVSPNEDLEKMLERFCNALKSLESFGRLQFVYDGKVLPVQYSDIAIDESNHTVNIELDAPVANNSRAAFQAFHAFLKTENLEKVAEDRQTIDPFSLY